MSHSSLIKNIKIPLFFRVGKFILEYIGPTSFSIHTEEPETNEFIQNTRYTDTDLPDIFMGKIKYHDLLHPSYRLILKYWVY